MTQHVDAIGLTLPEAPSRNAPEQVREAYQMLKATHGKLMRALEASGRYMARSDAYRPGWFGPGKRQTAEIRKAHSRQMDADFYSQQFVTYRAAYDFLVQREAEQDGAEHKALATAEAREAKETVAKAAMARIGELAAGIRSTPDMGDDQRAALVELAGLKAALDASMTALKTSVNAATARMDAGLRDAEFARLRDVANAKQEAFWDATIVLEAALSTYRSTWDGGQ